MSTESKSAESKPALMDVSKLPVEQAVSRLIAYSVMLPASDIFFSSGEHTLAINVRHLGIVMPISVVPIEVGRRYVSHVKVLAGMDVSEKRRPQDGRWVHKPDGENSVDLRVNMIPTMFGEDLALRILSRNSQLYKIEELGLTHGQLQELLGMLHTPSGLILITGPTGSGKTATLYASLVLLNDGKRKINTIEDPVEHIIEGMRQSQVNPQISLGFSDLLRSVLRQSPDIIMVGEVRDAETAETAVRAANSGHLVFATIHAPVAAAAVQSMRGLGVHAHFLSTCLRGIVSQRLVRTLCPHCKVSFDLSIAPHTFDEVRPWLTGEEGKVLYASKGCPQCQMTGYASRTGVFEVLKVSRGIRDLVMDGKPVKAIRDAAAAEKMLNFRQAALLKVAQGMTSTEEVFRVIPSEHLLEETLVG
ncbi:MAG TPA: GspE/PulE family protein [Tepidisphaeraceae bacterium]|jgi:general secretion pathway protein E|nr:GspE/PulE family protein [Tepidisphaeraceae bacterium]